MVRWCGILSVAASLLGASRLVADDVSFVRDISPLLVRHCIGCHGPNKAEGDLRLHTFEYVLNAGASGVAAVAPGRPDDSELLRRLIDGDESTRMPQQDDAIPAQEVERVRRWIAAGARFDGQDPKISIKSQLPPRQHPAAPRAYSSAPPVQVVVFSRDGDELLVGGHYEVTAWAPATGQLVRRFGGLPQRTMALAVHPAEPMLIVGGGVPGEYGELTVVDLRASEAPRALATFDDLVLGVAVNRAGSQIVAVSADRSVRCFAWPSGKLQWQSQLHSDVVTCVAFSQDDRFVVTGSHDFTLKVLVAEDGQLFTTYNGHQRQFGEEKGRFAIESLAASTSGPRLFSGGEGRSVRVWEAEKAQAENGSASDMEERFSKAGHTRYAYHNAHHAALRLVVNDTHLWVATGDGTIRQFDLATLEPVRDYAGHQDWVLAVDLHAGTKRLASGAFDGEVRVWNIESGEPVTRFLAAPGQ